MFLVLIEETNLDTWVIMIIKGKLKRFELDFKKTQKTSSEGFSFIKVFHKGLF